MSLRSTESIDQLIGQTPLLKLRRSLEAIPVGMWLKSRNPNVASAALKSELYAKVEFFNPGGSVKDRIALRMVDQAEKKGLLKKGGTIVEATSGNTGAGLAVVAAARGYKTIFCMPDKMSAEKINALRAYGSKVVICPSNVGPTSPDYYCNVAKRLGQTLPNAYHADQYFNLENPMAHYTTTGPELWEQMNGKIDVFVAGIGTGGTLSGTAKFLREKNPGIKIIAVDPKGSIYYGLLTTGKESPIEKYLVEGVGEDMIPGSMDLKSPNDCVVVNDEESFAATRMLAQKEGLLVGGSCGGAFVGAVSWLRDHELKGGKPLRAVVLLPDSGSRYLSKVFNDQWLDEKKVLSKWGDENLGGEIEYLKSATKVLGV